MGNSALKRHFETAEKTGVLNLSKNKLSEFPKRLLTLSSVLRTLDLSDNSLSALPSDIGTFSLLKSISCNNNRITDLPIEFCQLVKLETLSLIGNKLTTLPSPLSQLVSLKFVYLGHNQLKDFPVLFCGLKHLEVLDLSNNLIENIPSDIGSLRATELNLNQNRISYISNEISNCPRLKTLRLEENCLQIAAIPSVLLTNSKVSLLTLEGNLFEMKSFANLEGYDIYMERYTAVKKKMF
uniref:Leucine-rich repeat-containing protein 57 n=1 Tax=Graphocephala atropunctata TaxID=36148 RepID=A0A1B6MFI9_9HEMI